MEFDMSSDMNKADEMHREREALRSQAMGRSVMLFVTLASIGDAVMTTDSEGVITFVNPMAEALTGWSLADAVGTEVEEVIKLIDEATGEPLPNPIREALRTLSKVELPPDSVLIRKDGVHIPIDDSGAPILGGADELLGAILVFRDITDRKRAERVIKFRSELDRMAARISTAFITSPVTEVDARVDEALDSTGNFFGADRAYVFLYDQTDTEMTCTHEWRSDGVVALRGNTVPTAIVPYWTELISQRHYVRVSSIEDIPKHAKQERALWGLRERESFVAVPMSQEDRVIGFIGLDAIHEPKPWPEETINMLYLLGNVFASAMGRRDALTKLEAARAREVEIGSRIQQSLLLSTPPLASGDFLISALTIPSRGIDGDFYDFLLHPDRSLDIIFGDVMGKGVPAALLSAGAKTEFLRSLSHLLVSSARGRIPQPEDIVNGVHSVLTPQLLSLDSFVTLTYARFDPQARKVSLVDCGNTRLIRCSRDTGKLEHLSGLNLPLGFDSLEIYSQVTFDFSPGDLFVLYSDGVTEARNASGGMFGRERLEEVILRISEFDPEAFVNAVRDAVTEFVGSESLSDDLTCVAIRVVPEAPETVKTEADVVVIRSSLDHLGAVRSFLRGFCVARSSCGLTDHELNLVELAVNEVASNIMRHAYHGDPTRTISIRIAKDDSTVRIRLTHSGDPFAAPGKVPVPRVGGPREGGFGLFIISQAVDKVDYGQDDEGNQYIELTKSCGLG